MVHHKRDVSHVFILLGSTSASHTIFARESLLATHYFFSLLKEPGLKELIFPGLEVEV